MKDKMKQYDKALTDMHWDDDNMMWYKSIAVRFLSMIVSVVALILSILAMQK